MVTITGAVLLKRLFWEPPIPATTVAGLSLYGMSNIIIQGTGDPITLTSNVWDSETLRRKLDDFTSFWKTRVYSRYGVEPDDRQILHAVMKVKRNDEAMFELQYPDNFADQIFCVMVAG